MSGRSDVCTSGVFLVFFFFFFFSLPDTHVVWSRLVSVCIFFDFWVFVCLSVLACLIGWMDEGREGGLGVGKERRRLR